METQKKFNMDQIKVNQVIESSKTRTVLDKSDEHPNVVAVEMSKKKEPVKHMISLVVISSKELAAVFIDDKNVSYSNRLDIDRGIHVLVLNQATGRVMADRVFDTYLEHEDEIMVEFLNSITPGRVIIFAIQDEGTFHLKEKARQALTDMGSEYVRSLNWRDTWAFVTIKGGSAVGEKVSRSPDMSHWGERVTIHATIELSSGKELDCPWGNTDSSRRRREFCEKLEGYGDSVCNCQNPAPIEFTPKPLESGKLLDVPVAVIASNRPHYLYRMLRTMLQTPGVPVGKITVFIDGFFDDPMEVCRLLNVRGIQHSPLGVGNARITQHYKASLSAVFSLYPEAEYAIIIEEDLEVSPDFFNYFSQTLPLMNDSSLYCVSAWNDQGYEYSCKDPTLLYRIETMPGLGWLLKRSLFRELEPHWPTYEKQYDWDMWMRHPMIRKDRECIIPDISRTYHFGSKGLNMNPYFQERYFQKHSLMSLPNVKLKDVDKMRSEPYEILVRDLIKSAKVLDHSKDPCSEGFIPEDQGEIFVLFIVMTTSSDFRTWKNLAKCYKLWDLDVRGFHKSMWRQYLKDKHIVIVGVPASPYSDLKPSDVTPILLEDKEKKKDR